MALTLEQINKRKPRGLTPTRENTSQLGIKAPWQTSALPSYPESSKGEQVLEQRGTKGNNKGEQPRPKGEQVLEQRGTKGNNKGEQGSPVPLSGSVCSPLEGVNKGEQGSPVPLSESVCSPLEGVNKGEQTNVVPLKPKARSPLQRGTGRQAKGEQLPSSRQQMAILLFMATKQEETRLGTTARLRKADIAIGAEIPFESLKTQLKRLLAAGHLERLTATHGRGDAGCVYRVAAALVPALRTLKGEQKASSKGNNKGEQASKTRDVVSSSSTTTINQPEEIDDEIQQASALERLVERLELDLDPLRIGANDLLDALRTSGSNFDRFTASVEHIAFYLRGPDAKGLNHHRAWVLKKLKSGYYAPPAGFMSWEEQQVRAEMAAAREKLERLRAARIEKFQIELDLWLAEKTQEQLAALLKDSPYSHPKSAGARSELRQLFAQATGQEDMLELIQGRAEQ